MTKPHVVLSKNVKNEQAIRDYWDRTERANRRDGSYTGMFADLLYLVDTGRLTEEQAENDFDLHDQMRRHTAIRLCLMARYEDGDRTVWSDPPKTWLKAETE